MDVFFENKDNCSEGKIPQITGATLHLISTTYLLESAGIIHFMHKMSAKWQQVFDINCAALQRGLNIWDIVIKYFDNDSFVFLFHAFLYLLLSILSFSAER